MAEEAEPDTASWVEVQVTSLFTAVTSAAFLIVFEVCRRSTFTSQVFDRRRATAAKRCPPPLVRGRLLEWLFLSTDAEYKDYSEMAHLKQVVEERKRQQLVAGNRDFDDYARDPKSSSTSSPTTSLEAIQEDDDEEDDDGDIEQGGSNTRPPLTKSETGLTTKSSSSTEQSTILALANSIRKKAGRRNARVAHVLTPEVFVYNGRRLPVNVAEYALSGDLDEHQLQRYEQTLLDRENRQEQEFYNRQQEQKPRGIFWKLHFVGVRSRIMVPWNAICRLCSKDRKSASAGTPPPPDDADLTKSMRTLTTTSSSNGTASPSSPNSIMSRVSSGRSILNSFLSNSPTSGLVNRHLKSTVVTNKRTLGKADQELLRCVGLDAFVMIRFLRFGWDCTFYPFIFACLTLLPTYITNDYEGDDEFTSSEGYFLLTINTLEPESVRLWIPWGFSIVYVAYVLRKLWIEWEFFMVLRFDFLANGDSMAQEDVTAKNAKYLQKDDVRLHLEQYRNSCLIEYVPESHRRDKELFEFFDAVFPNQVKRAEILLNAKHLSKLIKERQRYIVLYEKVTAKYYHAKQVYRRKMGDENDDDDDDDNAGGGGCIICCKDYCCCCCCGTIGQPQEPMIPMSSKSMLCCGRRKMVRALPHYLSEIKRLNGEIEEEHRRIMVEKHKSEDKEDSQNIFSIGLRQGLKYVVGSGADFTCATGFVEFKNLTAKQNAIQCNISGTTNFMLTTPAPDPRDMVWENSTVELPSIQMKRLQCDALLFTAALFWSVVVTFITSISNMDKLEDVLPSSWIPEEDSFWYGLIQGYVPVLFLEFFMLFVPIILRIIGTRYIRFKTRSEVDKFVFFWHYVFRVCNLLIIMISGSIFSMLQDFQSSPSDAITQLASNIAQSSQFFLNNMIFAAGTENAWELAQMPKMLLHFVTYRIVTVEAKSKRSLERLEQAESFEWGQCVPQFVFALLIAAVYCAIVPALLGACAIFFYVAYKVYVHQALFVYSQPYEGGGKLMYMLNRTVFVILYIAIVVFSTVLGLRQAKLQAPSFFFVMMAVTLWVDIKVSRTFLNPSLTLALTNARIIDEENKMMEDRARRYQEYRAAKLEKQRNDRKSPRSKKLQSLEDAESAEAPNDRNTPERRRIQFSETDETKEQQVRKREGSSGSSTASSQETPPGTTGNLSKSGSKWEGGKYDFYLYRQPVLNKSLWETKPRPYR